MQESMQVSASARLFAEVTHEAREIVPVITQSFDVRIKGNKGAFNVLRNSGVPATLAASLLGKTLKARISWRACGGVHNQHFCFFELGGASYEYVLVNETDMKKLFTQKGLAPKMFKVWQDVKAAS